MDEDEEFAASVESLAKDFMKMCVERNAQPLDIAVAAIGVGKFVVKMSEADKGDTKALDELSEMFAEFLHENVEMEDARNHTQH
jgi:hypothetical protein